LAVRRVAFVRAMKLIIQVPCSNEADRLPAMLGDLPRTVPGVSDVEFLVVEDPSTDRTIERAWEHGANHVVRLTNNTGGLTLPVGQVSMRASSWVRTSS
jgi:glycosyltransferase involved in cell wall biosynthesis